MVGVQLYNKFYWNINIHLLIIVIEKLALRAGLRTLTSASVFFLNWALRLPSSSSVRVHPSRLVLSMLLYGLNCVLLARMRIGRCEWGAAFLPGCLGPNFAASPAVA